MNLLRWVIIILLFYLIFQVLKGLISGGGGKSGSEKAAPAKPPTEADVVDLVKDPYCGIYFPRSEGVASQVDGRVEYFLNEECRDNYIKSRQRTTNGGNG